MVDIHLAFQPTGALDVEEQKLREFDSAVDPAG
jgi:hypothetical protein